MKRYHVLFSIIILLIGSQLYAQPGTEWIKCYGGSQDEHAVRVVEANDGHYMMLGWTTSNDGDVTGNHGGRDYWLAKLNLTGSILWQKCYGGSSNELSYDMIRTSDNCFVIVGMTFSNDGDVTGYFDGLDTWVIKVDSLGTILWQSCIGGTADDIEKSIKQTSDGGYILCGCTNSTDNGIDGNHGLYDAWVVKLDSSGKVEWKKCYGGTNNDFGNAIFQTQDGGYVFAGNTFSNDGDVSGNHGYSDSWLVKLNGTGEIMWQKCLGGSQLDNALSMDLAKDGGYILGGYSGSNDGDVTGAHGNADCWVVKLDSTGTIQWQKCYGGSLDDETEAIRQTRDGGYISAGWTHSNDGDVTNFISSSDYWVFKLSDSGSIQWQKCFGGNKVEEAKSITQTSDSGYIVVGFTGSEDGDIKGNHGYNDAWLIKLSSITGIEEIAKESDMMFIPNPATDYIEISVGAKLALPDQSGIRIYNVFGQIQTTPSLRDTPPYQGGETVKIDVSGLASGVYFVRMGDKVGKFVKM